MKEILTCTFLLSWMNLFSSAMRIEFHEGETMANQVDGNKTKDSLAWVSHDDKIIAGAEISRLHMDVDFDNVYYYLEDSSLFTARTWDYWKFRTSHNPAGISYFLNSRFGKFNFYSHKISTNTSTQNFNTEFVNYGYSFQYRRLILGASYRRVQGFKRDNLFFEWKDTLQEMSNTDIRVSVEIIARETSAFNKYGFSQLYIPVKGTYYINCKSESAYTSFMDKSEVIPYYAIVQNSQGNTGKLDPNTDMQQFKLYMQSFLIHFGGIMPLFKKTGEKAKSLAFGFDGHVGFDMFYYTITPRVNSVAKSGLKMGVAKNTYAIASLRYAGKWFLMGVSLSWRLIYLTPAISTANKLTHIYFLNTLGGYMAFRIPFKKPYDKMRATREKLFGKSKKE